jgi:manganese/zinc/iron transport system permease protein
MFVGALGAGVLTTVIIEVIHRYSRVKQDAAIGIAFTSLFAIGVILIKVKSGNVHIDAECVLYGEIVNLPHQPPRIEIGPALSGIVDNMPLFHAFLHDNELEMAPDVIRMGFVALAVALLVWLFYKELLVSSFDPGLAFFLGINATFVHYALMCLLSVVVVSAFESVGAILVVAMLILPGATAHLLSARLPVIMGLTVIHAFFSTLMGFHLATWLDCSIAGAFVVAGMGLFLLAWFFSPHDGLLGKWILSRKMDVEESSGGKSEFVR